MEKEMIAVRLRIVYHISLYRIGDGPMDRTLAVHITGDGYRIVSLKHGSCAVSSLRALKL